MPSFLHEGLVALVKNTPEFAADLLRNVLHVEVPSFVGARTTDADFTEIMPAEYRADAVVLFGEDKPVFGVIVEVQLEPKPGKESRPWPSPLPGRPIRGSSSYQKTNACYT